MVWRSTTLAKTLRAQFVSTVMHVGLQSPRRGLGRSIDLVWLSVLGRLWVIRNAVTAWVKILCSILWLVFWLGDGIYHEAKVRGFWTLSEVREVCRTSDWSKETCITVWNVRRVYLKTVTTYFRDHGIVNELTAGYLPHHNGIAERFNRTCLNLNRSMLHRRRVPMCFWAQTLTSVIYIRDLVTSRFHPSSKTTFHFWKKETPNIAHLGVLRRKCWYALRNEKVRKLEFWGYLANFVAYVKNEKAYNLLDVKFGMVLLSRDGNF